MSTTPHTDIVELTPSTSAYFADMGKRALWLIPLVAFFGYRSFSNSDSPGQAIALIVLIVVTAGVSAGIMIVHFRTSRIRLETDRIVHTGALVSDKSMPIATLRGLLAPVTQPMTPASRMLVLQDASDATTLRLVGSIWSDDDLHTIATRTGVSIEDAPLSVKEVEERFPGSMPYWMRHPWLIAWGIVIVLVVVIGAAVVVLA